jgi:iron-sulfur cluster assembly protein
MLQLTKKAVETVLAICEGESLGLRVSVGKGCSGLSYSLGLEEAAAAEDQVLEFGDLKVFVDPMSALWLTGATMDYLDDDDDAAESGFVFANPNAPATAGEGGGCSCGSGGGTKSCR